MTDNKSLEESFARRRMQDLKKISYHAGIPVEVLEGYIAAKDEPLPDKENK